MATDAGEIQVTLTLKQGDFNKLLNQSQQQLQGFSDKSGSLITKSSLAITGALLAIATFAKSSIDAYAEYETSVTRLTAALNAQGITSSAVVGHLTALAQHLQDLTGVSDNSIISAQALLTTFGLQGATLDKATKAAIDLSAAMGIDLERAAQLLGKAYEGNTSSLARYGIMINTHTQTSQKFAAVMDQVNSRFGGAAQAQAQTYAGKMNIMKAAFEDLEKAIGKMLTGVVGPFIATLTDMLRRFTDWVSILGNVHSQMGSLGSMLSGFISSVLSPMILAIYDLQFKFTAILDKLPFLHRLVAELNVDIADGRDNLIRQISAWQKSMDAAQASTAAKKRGEEAALASIVDTTVGVVDAAETQTQAVHDQLDEEVKLRVAQHAQIKKDQQDFVNTFITSTSDMWQEATSLSNNFINGVGQGFAKMIVEGKNFSESMKALFRDMAEEIIQWIIKMIIKMLIYLALREAAEHFGPVGQAISTAMAVSAHSGLTGMASGGFVTEPSVVTGLVSGQQKMIGEAGPEAVMPMNTVPNSSGPMGGGITINVTGQFVEADPATWQKLINEKIVPAIRRFTMSTPTGPFTRRRGVA